MASRLLRGGALLALLSVLATCWFLHRYFGSLTPQQVLVHLVQGGLDQADPAVWRRAARYALVTVLLAVALGWLMARLAVHWRRLLWGALAAGAVVSVGATLHDPCDPSEADLLAERYVDPGRVRLQQAPGLADAPDLLIVFVESLDEAYAHPRSGRPPLVPELVAWRQPQRQPGQLRMLDGAHWTMGGMFAALCGLHLQPVGLVSRGDYERTGAFFAGGTCLTDLLAAQGWELSFHGGASLAFAGKGRFLSDHAVARRFGREQWRERGLALPASGWGLQDHQLVQQVWSDIDGDRRPARARPPQAHLMLTVNTHAPFGNLEPGCGTPTQALDDDDDDEATLRAALRCTDASVAALVQRFTARADGRPKLVWVMGDHVMPRAVLADETDPAQPRQGVFAAWALFDGQGREVTPALQPRAFSHVDVLPTLAEAAGLRWQPHAHRLGLGVSLLAPDAGGTLLEQQGAVRLERRLACPSPLFQQLWARVRPAPLPGVADAATAASAAPA